MQKITKNTIAKQAAILGTASIIVRAIGLLYRIPLSNIIGDIGNNYYGIAFNIYTVLLLLSGYSIPLAVSKLISEYRALGQYKNAHKVFISSLIFVCITSGILSVLLYIFSPAFLPAGNEKAVFALKTLAPTLFISGFIGVFQGYFQARRNTLPTAIAQIIEQVINAITSILFAFMLTRYVLDNKIETASLGALGSTLGTLFGALSSVIFLYFVYKINFSSLKRELRRDTNIIVLSNKTIFNNLLILVLPIVLSTLVTNIMNLLDQYLYYFILTIKNQNNITATINYGVYVGKVIPLHNIPASISFSIAVATLPAISIALAKNNRRLIQKTISESVTLSMLFAMPAAVGLIVLAKPILDLLFPGTPPVGYISLRLIAILVITSSYGIVLSGVLQGLGKPVITLIAGIKSVIINVIVLVTLLYFTNLGVYAIIISVIPANIVLGIIYCQKLHKLTGYRQKILKPIVLPLISSIIMGMFCFITYSASHFILRFNVLALIVTIPLTIIFYGLCILKLRFVTIEELSSVNIGKIFIKILRKMRLV